MKGTSRIVQIFLIFYFSSSLDDSEAKPSPLFDLASMMISNYAQVSRSGSLGVNTSNTKREGIPTDETSDLEKRTCCSDGEGFKGITHPANDNDQLPVNQVVSEVSSKATVDEQKADITEIKGSRAYNPTDLAESRSGQHSYSSYSEPDAVKLIGSDIDRYSPGSKIKVKPSPAKHPKRQSSSAGSASPPIPYQPDFSDSLNTYLPPPPAKTYSTNLKTSYESSDSDLLQKPSVVPYSVNYDSNMYVPGYNSYAHPDSKPADKPEVEYYKPQTDQHPGAMWDEGYSYPKPDSKPDPKPGLIQDEGYTYPKSDSKPEVVPSYYPTPDLKPVPKPEVIPSYYPTPDLKPVPKPEVIPSYYPTPDSKPVPKPEIMHYYPAHNDHHQHPPSSKPKMKDTKPSPEHDTMPRKPPMSHASDHPPENLMPLEPHIPPYRLPPPNKHDWLHNEDANEYYYPPEEEDAKSTKPPRKKSKPSPEIKHEEQYTIEDDDDHHYHHPHEHEHEYEHEHKHEKDPPKEMKEDLASEDRLNKRPYSYYYIGRKLWYVPLYFSVYFIIYVTALIIKSIARHRINYPASRSVEMARSIREKKQLRIDDATDRVNASLINFRKQYIM